MTHDGKPVMHPGAVRAAVALAVVVGTLAIAPFTVQRCPDGTIRYWGAPPCPPIAPVTNTPAFPAALGFGKQTSGGRGGDVYHVTNLNATGAGSLHEGIDSATGPRTIVFDTGGTTAGMSAVYVNKSDITIAGETAPGDGFCVKGDLRFENCDNIIVRNIRVRCVPLPSVVKWSLWFLYGERIYIEGCSFSWSTDEMLAFTDCEDVTVAHCLCAEWCRAYTLEENGPGKSAMFFGDCRDVTVYQNVMSTTAWRMPLFDGGRLQLWENVFYNCADHSSMALAGVDGHAPDAWVESVSNLRLNGPAAEIGWPASQNVYWKQAGSCFDYGPGDVYLYVSGNKADNDRADGLLTLVDGLWYGTYVTQVTPWTGTDAEWPVLPTPAAIDANWLFLRLAGAGYVNAEGEADTTDDRIRTDINNRASASTGTVLYFTATMSDTYPLDPAAVGGYPTLATGSAPLDTDQDGMPDSYEDAAGLSKTNAADGNIVVLSTGYTNLETYLNTLL